MGIAIKIFITKLSIIKTKYNTTRKPGISARSMADSDNDSDVDFDDSETSLNPDNPHLKQLRKRKMLTGFLAALLIEEEEKRTKIAWHSIHVFKFINHL